MNALKVIKEVVNGKVLLDVPSELGKKVEIIILPAEKMEFWTDEEIDRMGEVLTYSKDVDNENYSKW
jgi:hypothetical protein